MNFVKEGGQEKIVLAGSMHKGMVPSFLLKITQGFFFAPVIPHLEGGPLKGLLPRLSTVEQYG